MKMLNELGIEGTYLLITKAMYDKTRSNTVLNRKKMKALSLTQEYPLSPIH
jgi:hypothetical protein